MPFSDLVKIHFKYFKNLSSLQFQNSLNMRSLFYTLKSCFNYFISGVEFTALKYLFTIILFHMALLNL